MAVNLPREVALKIIYDINENGAYSNIALNKHLEESNLKELDRGFVTELVYGTVKWKLSIDWAISQFSSIKLKKISPWILNVLRLGVYQLLYMDRIPESAACNESVTLARRYGHSASSGFVNAVLRNIARNKHSIKYPDKSREPVKYLSVRYSYPEWLVESWVERFGTEFTEGLLESGNKTPELTVRANTLKISSEELADRLVAEGVEVEKARYMEDSLILKNPSSLTRLTSFKEGRFQVQDESSTLVGKVLDPQPGNLVLDVCSAPGGKATHIAQLMKNTGKVVARDIHEHKIKIIEEAAKRLGITIIQAEMYDAAKIDHNYKGKADCVLVDAPCTGLGIIRKKPDIKWSRNLGDKKEITELQSKILAAASSYVKAGGTLVYSTCTIEPEENEEMVKVFLLENKDFEMENIERFLPQNLKVDSASQGFVQLYPNIHGIDGFFIARMKRRS